MLILSSAVNETIIISVPGFPRITIMLIEVRGDKARIGVTADKSITVHRGKIQKVIDAERLQSLRPLPHPDVIMDQNDPRFGEDFA